ncbi:MAG: hypothetical protein KBD10_00270 [Candidatus Pacebacteria bacterium]|nr:hypothetical protein [Candidatus Paceibacterota bacterium]
MTNEDIQFDEEYGDSKFHIRSRKLLGEPTTPAMVNFLLSKKIAKNEKQALIILGCVIAVFLSLSIYIIDKSINKDEELIIINKYGQQIPFDDYVEMINKGVEPIR